MMALPPGWQYGWAQQQGMWYYFNTFLGITQWEPPNALAKPPATSLQLLANYEDDSDDDFTAEKGALPSSDRSEDRDPQWAASVALAKKLGQAQGASKRRVQTSKPSLAAELTRHLYEPAPASAPAPVSTRAPGLSYAMAAGRAATVQSETGLDSLTPRRSHALLCSQPNPSSQSSMQWQSAKIWRGRKQETLCMLIDGANVAFKYGEANGRTGSFCARGIMLAVEYLCVRLELPQASIAVVLNENRWDPTDADLAWLEKCGLISWTPSAKDDDVFLLTAAADHEAWVITNDRWTDHRAARHATAAVKVRTLRFGWIREVFAPAADDLGRFSHARGSASGARR